MSLRRDDHRVFINDLILAVRIRKIFSARRTTPIADVARLGTSSFFGGVFNDLMSRRYKRCSLFFATGTQFHVITVFLTGCILMFPVYVKDV